MYSNNRKVRLSMQTDSNLVIYCDEASRAIWASDTMDRGVLEGLYFQGDNNLVLYKHNRVPVWSPNVHNRGGDRLIMQDDGNLVLYKENGAVAWSTGTHGQC